MRFFLVKSKTLGLYEKDFHFQSAKNSVYNIEAMFAQRIEGYVQKKSVESELKQQKAI